MLTHLNEITTRLDKLILGFTDIKPRPTWSIYLDTWKMIDEGKTEITNLPLYKLMVKHYCKRNVKRRTFEKNLLGLNTIDCNEIAYTWVKKHIDLYHSIKEKGFNPELRHKPIAIKILNDGTFFLLDGTHTVSILRHLGTYENITVKVRSRDGGWESLKRKLYGIYGKKLLYQPINHPDFADWDVDRPSPHRWEVIEKALGDVNGYKIIDIGSCTGWFSIQLAKLGANVTGVEPHKTRTQVAKTLALYEGLKEDNPRFLLETFEENLLKNHYDICLALSVLHHYLRANPETFYEAVKLISLHCDKLILEMGINRQPITWRHEIVLEHSNYTKYTVLYDGERPIILYQR